MAPEFLSEIWLQMQIANTIIIFFFCQDAWSAVHIVHSAVQHLVLICKKKDDISKMLMS